MSRKQIIFAIAVVLLFAINVYAVNGIEQYVATYITTLAGAYMGGNMLANGKDRPEQDKYYSSKYVLTLFGFAVLVVCYPLGWFSSVIANATMALIGSYTLTRGASTWMGNK